MVIENLDIGKNSFLKIIPPPRFLTMPAVGLNISDHSIKIMEIVHKASGKTLGRYGDEPIPDGIIKNGNINNREALRGILSSVKDKYKLDLVRVSIPEEKAYVFRTEVPFADNKKEIRNSIEFQLEENVPISSNEAIFDYEIIPGEGQEGELRVSVSVLPQKVIASYVSLFNEAGLEPISFEIEAESIARAIITPGDMGTYMVVDYGRTRTGFSIVSKGVVRYTSTVDIGGESIVEVIQKSFDVSREKAEEIKMEKGFVRGGGNEELFLSLANIVSVLKDEMNKRYIYWHTHENKKGQVGEKIEKIILCGGNSNLPGLDEHLAVSMKTKVEKANAWTNVFSLDDFVPPIKFGDSLSYTPAIGLALRHFSMK